MSYQDKLDRTSVLIEEHNKEKGSKTINAEEFVQCVKVSGGTSEDLLKSMSYDDIFHV